MKVGEVAELRLIDGGLRPDRERGSCLRDDYTDLVGRNLHPGELGHVVDEPELETKPRHKQVRLKSGFTA